MANCTCGNPSLGFDCVCEWVKQHPGDNEYTCNYCGLYNASKPRCHQCEQTERTATGAACGNPECGVSTGVVSGLTFGSGELNDNGYWEHPCFECARAYEADNPGEVVWPFEGQSLAQLKGD
jgi:hypothetical protein